ncbi:MAG: hypothetical protein R3242_07765, partial [Akkermansiaceae bacterium]|nr:hypothetical protein [Akkermansiaceae bacterium]
MSPGGGADWTVKRSAQGFDESTWTLEKSHQDLWNIPSHVAICTTTPERIYDQSVGIDRKIDDVKVGTEYDV